MSKRSKNHRRDIHTITNSRLSITDLNDLDIIKDRRLYIPTALSQTRFDYDDIRSTKRDMHSLFARSKPDLRKKSRLTLREHSYTLNPTITKALVCARRAIRKSVIIAKGGSGSNRRKPKYTEDSKIRCRR